MIDVFKELLFSAGKGGPNFRSEHIAIRDAVRTLEASYDAVIERPIKPRTYHQTVQRYKAADKVVRDLINNAVDLPYAYTLLARRCIGDMWSTALGCSEVQYKLERGELADRLQTLYRSRVACHLTVAKTLAHWLRNALHGRYYPLYLPVF